MYIKNILESKKYKIIGEIKSANDKVLCKDENGYKFLVTPMGIIRRNEPEMGFPPSDGI